MKYRRISRKYLKPRWPYLKQDKKGTLHIHDTSIKGLAEKYGTPLYIFVESEIRSRVRRFKRSFPYQKFRPQYASKCNSNLEILRIMREEGMDIDASSVGEIILALLADFEPREITFTNLHKTDQDIMFAAKIGVQAITIDSVEELERVAKVAQKMRTRMRVFIRVNPLITLGKYTSKHQQYGIANGSVAKAIRMAKEAKYVDLIGLHFHGSYISDPKVYEIAAQKLIKHAVYCKSLGIKLRYIDLGGGFPFQYNDHEVFQPEDMGAHFVQRFEEMIHKADLSPPTLIFEPGKFMVANAGIGLVRVISKKKRPKKRLLVVDGSTYAFLPDPMIYKQYYEVLPVTKMNARRTREYTIAGCTCDCIDILARNRWLPKLEAGDLVTFMDCGAYSSVMASNFNTLKRPAAVMVKENGTVKSIRRRDRYSEMFAPELDVLKVADPQELKKFYDLTRINIDKLWNGRKKK
ncbi:diaminopimelate decarboxylase [Candidatus Woesearchaeota archaeon]|nr:diaminopimelate decarboxylase [Candidatus Woesearchaeota archaeon]